MPPRLLSTASQVDNLFTAPPLLSTQGFCWRGTHVDCRWEPPGAIEEEVSTPWHSVVLFTQFPGSEPVWAERSIDGRFKSERVHPGDILVLPAGVGQRSRWNAPGEFMNLVFETAALGRSLDEAADGTTFELIPHFATQDLLVLQLGLCLRRVLQSGGERLYAEALTTALAVHLLQTYATRKPQLKTYGNGLAKPQLQRVVDYIHSHLDADLSLETLSTLVGMSAHYFAQLFKQSTGAAPHQYVIRCRVQQAKTLLAQPDLPIADIACRVGFAHQSHLNRHFRRLVGTTPGQWRQANRF
ncbi:AraC family transcriptional regulator [Nodosilinea sp. FACHB-13]|uniref:helix-turn-helix domain-containing protein n=1 Tax=Cyanophyceae TaxID=3028117 RepID=UPI001685A80A|nr:AraC family transcriptional regulator [Nodosilinea sp. FACHB-13]MBD2107487.1 helix-turn-helix transcriptional regulator [Nodosilinea sp. FACHB-13]